MKHPFRSAMASQFETYVLSRKAACRWCKVYDDNLHFFDNYCAEHYPGQATLCEGMLEWCKERPTEKGNSCKYRISVVIGFVKFANSEGWTDIAPPQTPTQKPCLYIPHAFTQLEISQLFTECDKYVINSRIKGKTMCRQLNLLELPVYFRLLYSTGMRTNEARLLKCSDVDLSCGVININQTKGFDQHRVVLHESMRVLLEQYDKRIAHIMPRRIMFFPDKNDAPHTPHWAEYFFVKYGPKLAMNQPGSMT